jgi:hypothetical protein
MDESKSDAELLERAEKRVKQKVRLLYSAGLWVVFSVFFFLIWLLTGRGYQWFWWPIAGLGFALFLQWQQGDSHPRPDGRKRDGADEEGRLGFSGGPR